MNAESEKLKADRQKRKALLATARLMAEGGGATPVRVRNLSTTGLGGVSDDPLIPGTSYTVMLKGIGEVRGEIVWASGTRFGMHFDEEIRLESLEMSDLAELVPKHDEDFYRHYKETPETYRRPALRPRK
ncbi:MAG: PilZ domain-containing protein [Parasphingopyxis sp.]